jgi:quercetin dioxygenase-like cupin family protein
VPFIEIADKIRFSPEKMVKSNLCETERMFCDVYCLLPGQAQKVHAHDDADKIYVVLSGRPTAILGDEERALEGGQAAWAPAGVPHGVRNDTAEQATLLVFQAKTRA